MALSRLMGVLSVAILTLMLFAVGLSAQTQPPEETIKIPSLTMTDAQFFRGDKAGAIPVELTGKLQFPASGKPPYPAVILLHGSDGPASALPWNWAKVLNRIGIATLRIDSYSGRGFEEIYTDQGRVGEFNNIIDTFQALHLLAADLRIDPKKIAVMGFSRGGIAALYSSMARFQRFYGSANAKLAAHLPFYPPCNFQLEGELELESAPIRAFHGEADIWNPLPRCRAYIERLKGAGNDATISVYPNAHHAFDHPGSPAYSVMDNAQTSRKCFRREEKGQLINSDTGTPFSWKDGCVEMGPVVQFNSAAADAAEREVKSFLVQIFKLE